MPKKDRTDAAVSPDITLDNVADALHDRSYLSSYANNARDYPDTKTFKPADNNKEY